MARMHGGRRPNEKAKDFKGTMKKLIRYMAIYKVQVFFVAVFAICGTIFNIVGPKILGKATTEIFNGLVSKVSGGDGMNFGKIGQILLTVLCLYVISAICSFVQGYLMTGVSQKTTYRLRREISEKINRMPMSYFDTKPVGEVLSRVTNDVDTLGQSLNQSATQMITSVTTLIGVFIMMLSISPLMTVIAVLILPLSAGLIGFVMKHSQKYFVGQQTYLGNVNGQVEEIYGGHNIIKAFNKEEEVIEVLKKAEAEGKMTARVHTGDPAVFGAHREQMDELSRLGIDYDVIPGVSSFLATAAALKKEYTLPGVSQTVILTRMEGRTPMPPKEKLRDLAKHNSTFIFFLSVGMI